MLVVHSIADLYRPSTATIWRRPTVSAQILSWHRGSKAPDPMTSHFLPPSADSARPRAQDDERHQADASEKGIGEQI